MRGEGAESREQFNDYFQTFLNFDLFLSFLGYRKMPLWLESPYLVYSMLR